VRARRGLPAALAVLLAAVALAPAGEAKPAPAPTRLLVRGQEYRLLLSSLKVNPGNAIIQFANAGEDAHDLQIQRLGDGEQLSIGELAPGDVGELGLHLERDSRYVMWCSLPNHRELGMEASVRVRRKRR
jgi:plastocyanin